MLLVAAKRIASVQPIILITKAKCQYKISTENTTKRRTSVYITADEKSKDELVNTKPIE